MDKRAEYKYREVEWFIAKPPGNLRVLRQGSAERKTKKIKALVRAKVEHPFLWIRKIFGYSKVRYSGFA